MSWVKIALVLTTVALTGCAAPIVGSSSTAPSNSQAQISTAPSLAPLLKQVIPAVVNIATEGHITLAVVNTPDSLLQRFFQEPDKTVQRRISSLGSGVIIDAKAGYIITNYHVIRQADNITVTLNDGRFFRAKLVASDKAADLALLGISAPQLQALMLADSPVQVGDFVLAIGNPFGLGQSVTSGIVSALDRSGIDGDKEFIQTDASINPGSSGGALVDLQGRLVGINTAILAPSGSNAGISFAIPAQRIKRSLQRLLR